MMSLEQYVNVGIILLLVCTIFYVQSLNRRLRLLQAHKEGLQTHLQKLVASLETVQGHFEDLHNRSQVLIQELNSKLIKGHTLQDELQYFLDKAEKQANALYDHITAPQEDRDNMPEQSAVRQQGTPKTALMRLLKRMR